MKKARIVLCAAIFAAVCAAAMWFSGIFTDVEDYYLGIPDFQRCEIVDESGGTRPLDRTVPPEVWGVQPGERCRIVLRLPTVEELPELYEDGYLSYDPLGADTDIFLGEEKVFHSSGTALAEGGMLISEVRLAPDPSWAGRELTMEISNITPGYTVFYAMYGNQRTDYRIAASFANMYSLPGGAFLMVFIFVTGVFLMGLALGSPDWSLAALALMAGSAAAWNLAYGLSYYFLGDRVTAMTENRWLFLIPLGFMALYLLMNFRRSFLRKFGLAVLFSLLVLAAWYLVLRLLGSERAAEIELFISLSLQGYPPLVWILEYLASICSGIAIFELAHSRIAARSEARTLSMRQDMLQESYRTMEHSVQDTAVMRHEWKNQISTLHLLAEKGDLEGLNRTLSQLDVQLERLSPRKYSKCLAVNVILQNAAARAQEAGVEFNASAPLPEEPGIDEADLCALLINMLDNALHAASQAAPDRRFVNVSLRMSQGFLAVKCENGYAGPLPLDRNGRLSAGTSPEGHGYGLSQMRLAARKYGGILDTSWTEDTFTVQTALSPK